MKGKRIKLGRSPCAAWRGRSRGWRRPRNPIRSAQQGFGAITGAGARRNSSARARSKAVPGRCRASPAQAVKIQSA